MIVQPGRRSVVLQRLAGARRVADALLETPHLNPDSIARQEARKFLDVCNIAATGCHDVELTPEQRTAAENRAREAAQDATGALELLLNHINAQGTLAFPRTRLVDFENHLRSHSDHGPLAPPEGWTMPEFQTGLNTWYAAAPTRITGIQRRDFHELDRGYQLTAPFGEDPESAPPRSEREAAEMRYALAEKYIDGAHGLTTPGWPLLEAALGRCLGDMHTDRRAYLLEELDGEIAMITNDARLRVAEGVSARLKLLPAAASPEPESRHFALPSGETGTLLTHDQLRSIVALAQGVASRRELPEAPLSGADEVPTRVIFAPGLGLFVVDRPADAPSSSSTS